VGLHKVKWNRSSKWIYSPQVSTLTSCSSMDLIGLSEWTTSSCQSVITSRSILSFSCWSMVNCSFLKTRNESLPLQWKVCWCNTEHSPERLSLKTLEPLLSVGIKETQVFIYIFRKQPHENTHTGWLIIVFQIYNSTETQN